MTNESVVAKNTIELAKARTHRRMIAILTVLTTAFGGATALMTVLFNSAKQDQRVARALEAEAKSELNRRLVDADIAAKRVHLAALTERSTLLEDQLTRTSSDLSARVREKQGDLDWLHSEIARRRNELEGTSAVPSSMPLSVDRPVVLPDDIFTSAGVAYAIYRQAGTTRVIMKSISNDLATLVIAAKAGEERVKPTALVSK